MADIQSVDIACECKPVMRPWKAGIFAFALIVGIWSLIFGTKKGWSFIESVLFFISIVSGILSIAIPLYDEVTRE